MQNAQQNYKLQRLEIYNWGTFHDKIWTVYLDGHNSLLTGDIGSGKSTLVDAITTLLVPYNKVVFNKAAGAESKERTLTSYMRGEYKAEKDHDSQLTKSITLRDNNNYSVLLAYFEGQCSTEGVTLAQVFWFKDNQHTPERFFVVAQGNLSILQHFSDFGKDLLKLKKKLRTKDKEFIEVFDSFKHYSQRFRFLMGIQNEQALELFYQTVSLKTVGNLTTFVRNHMLDQDDMETRVQDLCNHFDDLNRAHASVVTAREQIELLRQLVDISLKFQADHSHLLHLRQCRELLAVYMAGHHEQLLQLKSEILHDQQEQATRKVESLRVTIERNRIHQFELQTNLAENGGRRLNELAAQIKQLSVVRDERKKQQEQYFDLVKKLSLEKVATENKFYQQHTIAKQLLLKLEDDLGSVQNTLIDSKLELKTLVQTEKEVIAELQSLARRKNNIPLRMLQLREELADDLNLDVASIPFIGEILEVKTSESNWEPALERLLHSFGLSLLIPGEYYSKVSSYVNKTNLNTRLIYYRVDLMEKYSTETVVDSRFVVNKLAINTKSEFYGWVRKEIINRFDYICCDKMADFVRLSRAITVNGQIKTSQQRHEKDDRHTLGDRHQYILGWNNKAKIAFLKTQLEEVTSNGQILVKKLQTIEKTQHEFVVKRDNCRDLLKYTSFAMIDWSEIAKNIEKLQSESDRIEKGSNILQTLKLQLDSVAKLLLANELDEREYLAKIGEIKSDYQHCNNELIEISKLKNSVVITKNILDALEELFILFTKDRKINLKNVKALESDMRDFLKKDIDNLQGRTDTLNHKVIRQMYDYKEKYPAETKEIDVAIAAIDIYANMLLELEKHDLPKHENRFKELLNEGTINSIALFQSQLNKSLSEIHNKITIINQSLESIEYSSGTYITIIAERNLDQDIRDFQQSLRQCLSNTLSDKLYSEEKFVQVKNLIDRFNGRSGLVDLDQRWRKKVTDVRNWVVFTASERWFHDHQEKECHSDSSGKSGGQKEKLAYTVLASALAYQFGLSKAGSGNRSFRFVVIDEAFGKGSDDSTKYALKLFASLNLQLLIVTPLQKINVIENYINSINFVANQTGNNSTIYNLTIEKYQEQKKILALNQHVAAS